MMRLRTRLHHPLAALALGLAATLAAASASAADAPSKATARAPHASAAAEPAQSAASQPLSKGEIKAIREFHMLDLNGDGKLSRKEVSIIPRLAAAFDDADTNHDGYVTLDEVRAYAVKYRAERDRAKAAAAAASAADSPAPAASAPAARK
ncbi:MULTISPECIES: EF-hand domain-containing protein [Comamonadaceae]|uniref:EF-hand domain-containing protein n=1 Tax=Acidovorax sacchari TaxID=3230736 RepID=UPI0034A4DD0B